MKLITPIYDYYNQPDLATNSKCVLCCEFLPYAVQSFTGGIDVGRQSSQVCRYTAQKLAVEGFIADWFWEVM